MTDYPDRVREAAEDLILDGAADAYQEWLNEDGEYTEDEFRLIRDAIRDAKITVTWDTR